MKQSYLVSESSQRLARYLIMAMSMLMSRMLVTRRYMTSRITTSQLLSSVLHGSAPPSIKVMSSVQFTSHSLPTVTKQTLKENGKVGLKQQHSVFNYCAEKKAAFIKHFQIVTNSFLFYATCTNTCTIQLLHRNLSIDVQIRPVQDSPKNAIRVCVVGVDQSLMGNSVCHEPHTQEEEEEEHILHLNETKLSCSFCHHICKHKQSY